MLGSLAKGTGHLANIGCRKQVPVVNLDFNALTDADLCRKLQRVLRRRNCRLLITVWLLIL